MNLWQQAPGGVQIAVHKRGVKDELRLRISALVLSPTFNLPLHRCEISLDAVDSHSERVNQLEALAVLSQDWCEIAADGHVRADKHANADRQSQPQRFVVRVADAD